MYICRKLLHMSYCQVSNGIDFLKLAKTEKWFVYAGEYLNKAKNGETGIKEKDKFVIWEDIIKTDLYEGLLLKKKDN